MSRPTLADVIARRPVVLDGGLATRLEERGHDLSSDLWSARLLLEDPDEIRAAHADYFAAGAEVAITSSYQVSYEGLAELGHNRAATDRLLRLSVELARAAAGEDQWVAASVGPYGAMLADGAEYRGDYGLSVAQLVDWHRPRLEALVGAQPDLLAMETIPCLAEAEALLRLLQEYGVPGWLSLTVDNARTRNGEEAGEAFGWAAGIDNLIAVGVNCCDPQGLTEVIDAAAELSGKPVVAYPNSGEGWDGQTRWWTGTPTYDGGTVTDWVSHGARLVGGCCRVGLEQITLIAEQLRA